MDKDLRTKLILGALGLFLGAFCLGEAIGLMRTEEDPDG